ncbi:glutathione S-transferase family protein [Thalassotalea litorea]|uniref:glutathione S-transferase family protein n=1 Tax=Thalassotalea litorea TaxID=2020715 RepID=UPI003736097E
MIKVVSFKLCPFVQRVTALLEAKNLPYELVYIQLSDKPQWFLDISPTGQVPVLITEEGTALFESDAIAEFLDDAYPAIEANVSATQKALDRAWVYQGSKHYLTQCSTMRSPDAKVFSERLEKLQKAFARAEQQLAQGPYFKGSQLSNIDMAWLPLLHRADIVRRLTGIDMLEGFAKVQKWQKAIVGLDLLYGTISSDFEQIFMNFYLGQSTYLGKVMRGEHNEQDCDITKNACHTCCYKKGQ